MMLSGSDLPERTRQAPSMRGLFRVYLGIRVYGLDIPTWKFAKPAGWLLYAPKRLQLILIVGTPPKRNPWCLQTHVTRTPKHCI